MLARLARTRLAELRADFRQYYSVGLCELGASLPVSEAADLAAQLPAGSRCATPEGEAPGWDDSVWLLARAEHALRVLAWQPTAAARDGEGFPEMVTPRAVRAEDAGVAVEQLEEILSRRRG